MNNYLDAIPFQERRSKPRIKCDCNAVVRGYDHKGKKFEEGGKVINLSRTGMYVLLSREIPDGTEVEIRMSFPAGDIQLPTSKLRVEGTVVRGEVCSDEIYGIGVRLKKFRFN